MDPVVNPQVTGPQHWQQTLPPHHPWVEQLPCCHRSISGLLWVQIYHHIQCRVVEGRGLRQLEGGPWECFASWIERRLITNIRVYVKILGLVNAIGEILGLVLVRRCNQYSVTTQVGFATTASRFVYSSRTVSCHLSQLSAADIGNLKLLWWICVFSSFAMATFGCNNRSLRRQQICFIFLLYISATISEIPSQCTFSSSWCSLSSLLLHHLAAICH